MNLHRVICQRPEPTKVTTIRQIRVVVFDGVFLNFLAVIGTLSTLDSVPVLVVQLRICFLVGAIKRRNFVTINSMKLFLVVQV